MKSKCLHSYWRKIRGTLVRAGCLLPVWREKRDTVSVDTSMRSRLDNIQRLRAAAALIVVIGHAIVEAARLNGLSYKSARGFNTGFGVDIFFVISGFIMIYTAGEGFGVRTNARNFLLHRIARVVPLYWLLTTAVLLGATIGPTLLSGGLPSWRVILGSYAFIPWPRADGSGLPILGPGWSLNYEMLFYAVFALALTFPRKLGLTLMFGLIGSCAVLGLVIRPSRDPWLSWLNPMMSEFIFGALLGLNIKIMRRWSGRTRALLFTLGATIFLASNFYGPRFIHPIVYLALNGTPAILLVAAAASRSTAQSGYWNEFQMLLGDASYSLYLTHVFTIRILERLWSRVPWTTPVILFIGVSLIVSVGVALAVYIMIERPLTLRARRLADRVAFC